MTSIVPGFYALGGIYRGSHASRLHIYLDTRWSAVDLLYEYLRSVRSVLGMIEVEAVVLN